MPWRNLTGLAKATAIIAVILLVSTGLCGLNFAAYGLLKQGSSAFLGTALVVTGALELLTMAVSAVFLVAYGIAFIIHQVIRAFRKSEPEQ